MGCDFCSVNFSVTFDFRFSCCLQTVGRLSGCYRCFIDIMKQECCVYGRPIGTDLFISIPFNEQSFCEIPPSLCWEIQSKRFEAYYYTSPGLQQLLILVYFPIFVNLWHPLFAVTGKSSLGRCVYYTGANFIKLGCRVARNRI